MSPPRHLTNSVVGRTEKKKHGRPADAFLGPEPGGDQGNLATQYCGTGLCFCPIFFMVHVILFSLCYAFSARHFPPSRDCRLCHLLISCWFSPFRLAPRHDGGLRESFEVYFPCHNACVLLQLGFLRLALPRHVGGSRGGFDVGLPYYSVCVSFNYFSSRFSWLHLAKPFRGAGVGFEEPHLRLRAYLNPPPNSTGTNPFEYYLPDELY